MLNLLWVWPIYWINSENTYISNSSRRGWVAAWQWRAGIALAPGKVWRAAQTEQRSCELHVDDAGHGEQRHGDRAWGIPVRLHTEQQTEGRVHEKRASIWGRRALWGVVFIVEGGGRGALVTGSRAVNRNGYWRRTWWWEKGERLLHFREGNRGVQPDLCASLLNWRTTLLHRRNDCKHWWQKLPLRRGEEKKHLD
jgi:hypothetical protein